jgi:ABC-type dipeptide/oligopeptide/nickel transport system permease component
LFAVPVILGVLLVVFFASHLIPGDPATVRLGLYATPEEIEALRHQLGLDRPLVVQLGIMLRDYATGDMGISVFTWRPVTEEIGARLPYTVALAVAGMGIATVLGVILGIAAAVRRNSRLDVVILGISTGGIAAPSFWLALMLSIVFAVKLRWFPTIGAGSPGDLPSQLRALTLPAVTLGVAGMAFIARMTRSSMLDVLREDYIRTARAKGLTERVVLFRHALKNAAIPIITIIGHYFAILLGGTIVIEVVFARPGLGKLLVDSIFTRDYPVIQGVAFCLAVSFVFVNLLTDFAYSILDPRVRQQ